MVWFTQNWSNQLSSSENSNNKLINIYSAIPGWLRARRQNMARYWNITLLLGQKVFKIFDAISVKCDNSFCVMLKKGIWKHESTLTVVTVILAYATCHVDVWDKCQENRRSGFRDLRNEKSLSERDWWGSCCKVWNVGLFISEAENGTNKWAAVNFWITLLIIIT